MMGYRVWYTYIGVKFGVARFDTMGNFQDALNREASTDGLHVFLFISLILSFNNDVEAASHIKTFMKKFFSYYLLCVCIALLVACNDEDVPSIPASIDALSVQKLAMGAGLSSTIEFSVTPEDAKFNYNTSSEECQIKLESVNASEANYQLSKVEPIQGQKGRYQATITDLQQSNNYKDQFIFVITNDDLTQIKSSSVDIYFSGTSLFSFAFSKESNPEAVLKDINIIVEGNNIQISTPFISKPQLKATFESNAEKILVNGVEQKSASTINDFSSPVTYKVVSAQGEEKEYVVTLSYSGLPVVIINTPNQATIPSKHEDWLEEATITILNPDGSEDYAGTTNIRGRGNSTWTYPKKPYALKLDEKAEILGMPKHKRWVLLANWMDRTLMRNRVAFQIALSTGMAWNPHGEFVDVVLNGKHIGNYYLCEHIKVDKNRVNIAELDEEATEGEGITGGFIMELDVYYDEVYKFKSAIKGLPYMFKDPDEVNEQQFAYMQNYVNAMEASIYNDEELTAGKFMEYLDMDSFIDWWFVHELAENGEPGHPKSTYMYKEQSGKLFAGPAWDFDWGTFLPGASFVIKHALYYPRLFQNATFVARVKERWSLLKPEFDKISSFIASEGERIKQSEKMNHIMWPITKVVNGDESMTFEESVQRMKAAYEEKLQWLDDAISKM